MTVTMPRQWLEVTDDDGDPWLIDMTFMLSTYRCTFGNGCPGAWTHEGYSGCCSTGPWFSGGNDTVERLAPYVDRLKAEHTDNYDEIQKSWAVVFSDEGESRVRKKDGYCIFFNKGKADGSTGCSLHSEAERQGEDWRDWKPEICWQVPMRNDSNDTHNILTAWDRDEFGGWGNGDEPEGGFWCIDNQANYPSAFGKTTSAGNTPEERVFQSLENEISRLVGRNAYNQIRAACMPLLAITIHSASVPVSIREKSSDD